jgi:ADP-heptose:LPS heptosyltransferase
LSSYNNILLVRTDRIGDVVLSLPAAALLREHFPSARITFLAREYTSPLIALSREVDEAISDQPATSAFSLARQLKGYGFDLAILLHPTSRLAWAVRLAGIPERVGTAYRAYSLLFSRRVRQHRRFSFKHELEHNLDLVRSGLGLVSSPERDYRPRIDVPSETIRQTEQRLKGIIDLARPFVVIHPGSGGSARDWPIQKFANLIDRIQGINVAVTLGPGEVQIKAKLQAGLKTKPAWISELSLPELAALLSRARLVLANSTGPLHIATAVGTKVVGLYCPMIPCHPRRWGPYGYGHQALVPPVEPCRRCLGVKCREYDCMDRITVDEVYARVAEAIQK